VLFGRLDDAVTAAVSLSCDAVTCSLRGSSAVNFLPLTRPNLWIGLRRLAIAPSPKMANSAKTIATARANEHIKGSILLPFHFYLASPRINAISSIYNRCRRAIIVRAGCDACVPGCRLPSICPGMRWPSACRTTRISENKVAASNPQGQFAQFRRPRKGSSQGQFRQSNAALSG
jgi:hypothetical protein